MDHRVPRVGVLIGVVLAFAAVLTFFFLNNRFEGPADPLGALQGETTLTAVFVDTKKLPTKQPVLYKGVTIGRVADVSWLPARRAAKVSFTVRDGFELHEDAVVRVGERSLVGDGFLDVVTRGSASRPVLGNGDEVANARPSVNFDEALDFLDEGGRRDVKALIATVARGTQRIDAPADLNDTLGEGSRAVESASRLTRQLRGQEDEITRLVGAAGTVLDELGRRENAIRTIVGSGRTTLEALSADTAALERGIDELPHVLDAGRRTLATARPLVRELREPVRDLRALTPTVERALSPDTRELAGDLVDTVDALTPLRRTAVPILDKDFRPLMDLLQPLVKAIEPAARSLVPALDYLSSGEPGTSRAEAIAGLYASIGAASKETDGKRGHYTRAGFSLDPLEMLDQTVDDCPRRGFCLNSYPKSGDALDPKPFEGQYPRVTECQVPTREHPTTPCR